MGIGDMHSTYVNNIIIRIYKNWTVRRCVNQWAGKTIYPYFRRIT
jgi:hypothetical protein